MELEQANVRTRRGVWQRAYVRTTRGKCRHITHARAWSAEDYDLLEKLTDAGLSTNEMRRYFTPTPTRDAISGALRRADIPRGRGRGAPSCDERAYWDTVYRDWREGKL